MLIVDDHDDSREVMAEILRQRGAHVIAVASAADALRVIDEHSLDVLLCDLEMPETDGYGLLERIRERRGAGRDLPAAAVTAYVDSAHRTRALAVGFRHVVPKPVAPDALIAVVLALRTPAAHDPAPA